MKLFLFAILATFTFCSFAQNSNQNLLVKEELARRGEVYFRFPFTDKTQLNQLSKEISIDKFDNAWVYAYANEKEFAKFQNHALHFEVLTAPSELITVEMTDDPKKVLAWDYYPTYEAYLALMQQFADDHPDICRLITIGTLSNTNKRKLLALKISKNPDIQEYEPEFYYSSTMHGDETTGYILMLHLIDYLTSKYGSDDEVTHLVDNMEIYICPLQNPDGTYRRGNQSVTGSVRYNAKNVDINRNYPDPRDGAHPDGNAWQEETVMMMQFYENHHFTMSANLHGGAELINYPWDTWTKITADDAWWRYVCHEYVDTVHHYGPSGYFNDEGNGVTNGAAWYVITGGQQDYMNYFCQGRESTIELSSTKTLPANQLESFWNYNYRSLLNYMKQATYGLKGIITDSITGLPLEAKVECILFDKDSSMVFSDPQVGNYHRLLKAGSYTVTFSAPEYKTKTFTVSIADRTSKELNVRLVPLSYNGIQAKEENAISIFPNPVAKSNTIEINSAFTIKSVRIFDAIGNSVLYHPVYSKYTSIPANFQVGMYYVKIATTNGTYTKKLVIQ